MSRIYYTAILERGAEGFGLFFPDLPGCVTAGDTVEEILAGAESLLELHLAGLLEEGQPLPRARLAHEIAEEPGVDEVSRVLVGASCEADEPKVRVNVMLDRRLVAAIDALHPNRSAFLNRAAREALQAG